MADLEFNSNRIIHRGTRDPEELQYYEETKKHLEAYNVLTLWKKARDYSEGLKNKGENALEQFNNKVNSIIDELNLKESDGDQPYCNPHFIREAVFTEVTHHLRGKEFYAGFRIHPETKYSVLTWGTYRLAKADRDVLEILKKRIEELTDNREVEQKIRLYEEVIAKMKENSYLEQFNNKIAKEIIKTFDMDIPLKGKCKYC